MCRGLNDFTVRVSSTSLVYISIGWEASYINDINSHIFLGSNINSKMYVYELGYENISIKFRIKKLKKLTLLLYILCYVMLYIRYVIYIVIYKLKLLFHYFIFINLNWSYNFSID